MRIASCNAAAAVAHLQGMMHDALRWDVRTRACMHHNCFVFKHGHIGCFASCDDAIPSGEDFGCTILPWLQADTQP